ASIKAFANFDDAMIKSTAIMTDVTTSMKKDMRDLAITLSTETTTSARELAEGYFYLASAGMDAATAMKALPIVNTLAIAGNFNLAKATELAADTMSAMGLDSKNTATRMKNLTMVTDILVGANVLANATTGEFAEAMQKAGPIMRSYGISIEGGVAALAAYAKQGKKGSVGGEMFSRMIRLSVKALIDNKEAWDAFGVSLVDADDKMRAFSDIGDDLTEALKGMGVTARATALDMLGFQARSQQALFPLLGMGDVVRDFEGRLSKMGGTAARVAAYNMTSFSAQMKIVWNNIVAVGIEIGDTLRPHIKSLGETIKNATKWWKGLSDATKNLIIEMFMMTAAIGPMLFLFGKMLNSLVMLKLAMFAAAGATGVLAAAFAILAAAAISWRLGTWARENFEMAARAHELLSGTIISAWLLIKHSFKDAVIKMRIIWMEFMGWLEDITGDVLLKISQGLGLMGGILGKVVSTKLSQYAHTLKQEAAAIKIAVAEGLDIKENVDAYNEEMKKLAVITAEALANIKEKFKDKITSKGEAAAVREIIKELEVLSETL
ncbi:unnamed protein product, partial [marine sediment metagenome]